MPSPIAPDTSSPTAPPSAPFVAALSLSAHLPAFGGRDWRVVLLKLLYTIELHRKQVIVLKNVEKKASKTVASEASS
ncbi:hypothetical protein ACFSKU_05870 [Pontibacter silvestris]|uniref:Uncharacterized protein n=1 Tax=Pontibacter silvestris TaxID=2305183 RepID=A0ABW4WXA7_9BACT|nr:hypothetical protein [Pontibacter silvestris]MCC9136360.1 hypothetical protein [Pontibacter silvestris]